MISLGLFLISVALFLAMSLIIYRSGVGLYYIVEAVREDLLQLPIPVNDETTKFLKVFRAELDDIQAYAREMPGNAGYGLLITIICAGVYFGSTEFKPLADVFLIVYLLTVAMNAYLLYIGFQAGRRIRWMQNQISFLHAYLLIHAVEQYAEQEEGSTLNLDKPAEFDKSLISLDPDDPKFKD